MGFRLNTVLKIYLGLFCFSNATQVTFIVDMSEETVVAGDGNYPAVYVSGANINCLLYTSPSPRDVEESRMPSSA